MRHLGFRNPMEGSVYHKNGIFTHIKSWYIIEAVPIVISTFSRRKLTIFRALES
jgi:hypothetical protein